MKARWLSLLAVALLGGCAWGEIRSVEMPNPGEPVLKLGLPCAEIRKVDARELTAADLIAASAAHQL